MIASATRRTSNRAPSTRRSGPGRRRGVALALGCAVLLLGAACDVSGDDPTASPSASPARPLTISAPTDCLVNAYCGRGLATTYGVDVADRLVASERVTESVAALEKGEVDVAVVFSHSPAVDDPDLVVLADDRGMLASERVTPVYRRSVTELHGADLAKALDDLSALITPDALTSLDAAVGSGLDPADAASTWLAQAAPGPTAQTRPGRALTIGSVDFLESRVLGEVVAGYLSRRGYPTTVTALSGGRAELVDALANGEVDVAVEYSASLLEYLNGFAGEAGADADATSARLAEYLDLIGVAAATAAPATSTNVFVTTKAIAGQRGLSSLSDLAGAGLPAAAVDGCADRAGPAVGARARHHGAGRRPPARLGQHRARGARPPGAADPARLRHGGDRHLRRQHHRRRPRVPGVAGPGHRRGDRAGDGRGARLAGHRRRGPPAGAARRR